MHACSSASSAGTNHPDPPAAPMSATTASPRSRSRPVTTTAAPSRANSIAIERPSPDVEPVTSARSPAIRTRRR